VAGETPGILATEDGGEGWTDLGSASLGRVRTFAFEATGQSGWAFTTRGTFSTGDGGKGWPSPKPALGPSDLATHWHFNEGFWADTSAVRLRVTPAAPGTAAPIPVAGGELFTTTAGKVFNLPTASGADTAAVTEQALGQAWQMGSEPGRFHAVLFLSEGDGTIAWAAGDGGSGRAPESVCVLRGPPGDGVQRDRWNPVLGFHPGESFHG
jgi:photosystem II stability/assembly factor-like uncharacterized protein